MRKAAKISERLGILGLAEEKLDQLAVKDRAIRPSNLAELSNQCLELRYVES